FRLGGWLDLAGQAGPLLIEGARRVGAFPVVDRLRGAGDVAAFFGGFGLARFSRKPGGGVIGGLALDVEVTGAGIGDRFDRLPQRPVVSVFGDALVGFGAFAGE